MTLGTNPDAPAPPFPPLVRVRLSAMVFLFYFAFGAWTVTLSTYLISPPTAGGLAFTTTENGWVYSTYAIGGMTALLFVGLLADRLFSTERVLGTLGLTCAVLLAAAGRWCDERAPVIGAAYAAAVEREAAPSPDLDPAAMDRVANDPAVREAVADTFRPLVVLMLGIHFCVQLGLTLCAVTSLRNLPDPARQFSRVRLFGTIGWVVAGVVLAVAGVARTSGMLYLGAAAVGAFGIYAFTLPHTPPKGRGKSLAEAFGVPALGLFRDRSFCVFIGVGFVAAAMNQFYAVYAHPYLTALRLPHPEVVMTLGQVVEVGCMFAIPLLDPRRRMKGLMLLGLGGWVLRAAVMGAGWTPAVVAVAVPMHGWSYAFYYIVAATYVDREAPPHLRASAQAVVAFAVSGAGPWAGNVLAGWVVDRCRAGGVVDWRPVWLVPLVGSTAALVTFALLFRPPAGPNRIDPS